MIEAKKALWGLVAFIWCMMCSGLVAIFGCFYYYPYLSTTVLTFVIYLVGIGGLCYFYRFLKQTRKPLIRYLEPSKARRHRR